MLVNIQTRFDGIIVRLREANESAMFPGIVTEALETIYSRPLGKALLDGIVANARKYVKTSAIVAKAPLVKSEDWLRIANASHLMEDLFSNFVGTKFRKAIHSVELTQLVLASAPENLRDVADIFDGLLKQQTSV